MAIPLTVKIFLAFATVASLFELSVFVPALKWLKEATVPFTGWGTAMPYFFALGSWPPLFRGRAYSIDVKTMQRYLATTCVILVISAAFGVFDFFQFGDLRDEANPWLR